MNAWNRLLAALDAALGFPHRRGSTVKQVGQFHDNKRDERVVWLEYRVSVSPGQIQPVRNPPTRVFSTP